jgi:hypothetical protein
MSSELFEFPAEVCFASITFGYEAVVARSASPFSLSEQSYNWGGYRWVAEVNIPPMSMQNYPEAVGKLRAFGVKMNGGYNTFLLGDTSSKAPRGVGTGTPLVDGAGQTGEYLDVKGFTPGVTGIMLEGDWVQIGVGSSAKLHMVIEDADTDTSGDTTLRLKPPLRNSPANNTPITVNNAKGLFRLAEDSFSWNVTPGKINRFSFSAVEVV